MEQALAPAPHAVAPASNRAGVQLAGEASRKQPSGALFLRGDHELNEIKAEKHAAIASPLTFATEEQIAALEF